MPTELPQIGDELVTELRNRFLSHITTNKDKFEEQDIEQIRKNDNLLKRFLQAKKANVDEALKQVISSLQWRKTYGINHLTEESFPREYFQMGCIFPYGKDVNGATNIIFRIKANKKIGEWTELIKKYIAYLIDQENQRFERNETNGICIVFDCNGAGIMNVDIDLLQFIVTTLRDHYPYVLKSVVVNELPWILNYVFKLVMSWLPKEQQELLHLVSFKDLNQYIAADQLPDFMKGTNTAPYKECPKTAPSAEEVAQKLNIKKKDLEKLQNHLEPYISGKA